MSESETLDLIKLAERTIEIEPLTDYERGQMKALDRLTNNETDRLVLREAFWRYRAEMLGVEEVAAWE